MRIAISSGHGLHVRGARSLIDEVDEARRVTDRVADILNRAGVTTIALHENTARTRADNVNAIVRLHNGERRNLDVSIHFNSTASGTIEDRPIGVEVLHHPGNPTTWTLAGRVAAAIAAASGLLLRHQRDSGAVARTNLGFLNNTTAPAILVEVCFVNSRTDTTLYQKHFDEICHAIASSISGQAIAPPAPASITIPPQPTANPQPSSWAQGAWEWGIVNGLTDGTRPRDSITRQEVITLLYRFFSRFF